MKQKGKGGESKIVYSEQTELFLFLFSLKMLP